MGRFKILLFVAILVVGCKDKKNELSEKAIYIVSPTGVPFEKSKFLPAPLTHGVMINGNSDSLNFLVISNYTDDLRMEVKALGAFKIMENDTSKTQFILALPKDVSLQPFDPMTYEDFVVKVNSAKVLIDQYYSNYKGLGKTRVIDWQNTVMADKLINDFWSSHE